MRDYQCQSNVLNNNFRLDRWIFEIFEMNAICKYAHFEVSQVVNESRCDKSEWFNQNNLSIDIYDFMEICSNLCREQSENSAIQAIKTHSSIRASKNVLFMMNFVKFRWKCDSIFVEKYRCFGCLRLLRTIINTLETCNSNRRKLFVYTSCRCRCWCRMCTYTTNGKKSTKKPYIVRLQTKTSRI